MNKLLSFVGVSIAFIGMFFFIAALEELIKGDYDDISITLGMAIFSLFLIGAGIYTVVVKVRERKNRLHKEKENRLLEIISSKGGKVTPMELAAESDTDFSEAKKTLDMLCKEGSGQIHITDDGDPLYAFPKFTVGYKKDPLMGLFGYLRVLVGGILVPFSLFVIISDISNIITGKSGEHDMILTTIVIFFLFFALGLFLIVSALRKHRIMVMETRDKEVLKLISEKEGRVTPIEIAAGSIYSINGAKIALDKLCETSSGVLEVTDNGAMFYVFKGFMTSREKLFSKNPLDM